MKQKLLKTIVFPLLCTIGLSFLLVTCEFEESTITPTAGIPILKADISLSDLLKMEIDSSVTLYTDENDLIHIYFSRFLDTTTMDKILSDEIPETMLDDSIPLDFIEYFPELKIEGKADFIDDVNITQIDTIVLNAGFFSAQLNINPRILDTFGITIPSFVNKTTGDTLIFGFNSQNCNTLQTVDLSDWNINFTPYENSLGLINLKMYSKVKGKNPDKTPPNLRLKLNNLDIRRFSGKMGNYTSLIEQGDSLPDFSAIDTARNNNINFNLTSPNLSLVLKNGFNVPIQIENFSIKMGNEGDTTKITGFPDTIFVNAGNGQDYTEGRTLIESSTNLENTLFKYPSEYWIKGLIRTNPKDSTIANSINDSDSLFFGVEADIPLDLTLSQVLYRDTILMDLSEQLTFDMKAFKFKVNIQNSLPLDLEAELWALDENDEFLVKIVEEPLKINSNYPDATPWEETYSNEFAGQALTNLLDCKKIELRFSAQTTSNEVFDNVQFLSSQGIKINIIGFAKAMFKLNQSNDATSND